MTLTDELIAELRALLAKMTAPSWEVFVREHPCRFGRNHRENWIVTAWSHGQLKGPVPVAASKVGVGAEGGEPVQMVHINDDDAAGIVALVNAAEPMLDEIERLREALLDCVTIIDTLDDYQKSPERGDYGTECACCMGELFDADEMRRIEKARAALGAKP